MVAPPTPLELTHDHGFVLAAVIMSVFIHHAWMGMQVLKGRKKYNINYPHMYAPHGHKNGKEFDCIQRAHQNSLENQPAFLILLLLAGAKYPVSASIAAAVYLLGRVFYFLGYASGQPQRRHYGAFMHLAYWALMGMVFRWAVDLMLPALNEAFEQQQ